MNRLSRTKFLVLLLFAAFWDLEAAFSYPPYMVRKSGPTQVYLFDRSGRELARFGFSQSRIADNFRSYSGRASYAWINGAVGSSVTFFDDQRFRGGQNHLTITLRENWVRVQLDRNFFLPRGKGLYQGYSSGRYKNYKWVLAKMGDSGNVRVDNVSSVWLAAAIDENHWELRRRLTYRYRNLSPPPIRR